MNLKDVTMTAEQIATFSSLVHQLGTPEYVSQSDSMRIEFGAPDGTCCLIDLDGTLEIE